jgi:hypothetical protein
MQLQATPLNISAQALRPPVERAGKRTRLDMSNRD